MTIKNLLLAAIGLLLATPTALLAQQSGEEKRAREIFDEVDRRRESITYETADMQMLIYDSRNRTRNRQLQSFSYNDGEVSRSLLIFEEPANVRGTAFLTLSEGDEDVQKLYLPALERIKIISASEKSDRFMGSDFTYEDLGDREPEDYQFSLIEETDTSSILRAEKVEESQYAWLRFYIDPERYVVQKIEYFNEREEMIKRLETGKYEEVADQVWQANRMVMFDLREDRKTELIWSDRQINNPIPDWRFTDRGLRRGAS
ncbi:MAG: outer membrane lipoprotein-sorting protein [Balneolaceae bacterium]|nr:outer membrane lipoprotein-sorting protein [Balneolaceae bacterium]